MKKSRVAARPVSVSRRGHVRTWALGRPSWSVGCCIRTQNVSMRSARPATWISASKAGTVEG
ncbi:MAG TPA: hypothetical protein VF690_19850 [Hymenobacter sp.]